MPADLAHARRRGRRDPADPRSTDEVLHDLAGRMRNPRQREADLRAQLAASRAGGERVARADRALRARHVPRRPRARRSTTPSGARARGSRSSTDGEREARPTCSRRAEGDLELQLRGDGRRRRARARLLRLGRAARRQPQLPARRDAVRLLLRPARADRPRRAALRRRLPAAHRDRARGLAAERAPARGRRGRQRRDLVARRRPRARRVRPRARPGHDEQPHARQRRLHLLRDARRRPGRVPRRRRPERGARGDVEHAQHARSRRSSSSSRCAPSSTRCGAARAAPARTAAATASCASSRRSSEMRYSLITERRRHAPPGRRGRRAGRAR